MKTIIKRQTALLTTTGIAVLGLAGLWAQNDPGKNATAERRDASPQSPQSQSEARREQFTGKLVSLTEYLGSPHGYSSDKGKADSPASSNAADTATASKSTAMENQPLGILISAPGYQTGQPGQPQPATGTPQTATRESGGIAAQGHQLCILLFDRNNHHLVAKAQEICQTAKTTTGGTSPGTTSPGTNTDTKTSQSTPPQQTPEGRPASAIKDSDSVTVSLSGKKVMRDGLTAIFVEDIQGAQSTTLRQ